MKKSNKQKILKYVINKKFTYSVNNYLYCLNILQYIKITL